MATQINWSILSGTTRLSRRTMIKVAAGSAIGLTSLLAACGDDDEEEEGGAAETPAAGGGTTPAAGAATSPATGQQAATPGSADTTGSPAVTGGGLPQREGQQGGELAYSFHIQQILTLDPAQVNLGAVAGELVANLFSGLVQFDEQLNIVPDLAETFEVSDDGTVYTFNLRDGLTFHNGDPLVAEDIIYTYNRTIDPAVASPHSNKLELITDIQAVDELTVQMTLSEPFAPFLGVACSRGPGRALAPISKRAIDELGNDQFGLKPVGCGPFKIVPETADLSQSFEMVPFEDWYGGRPFLDKITVRVIPEPSSRISALEAGDIDFLNQVPTSGFEQIQGNDQFVIVEAPGTNWIGLTMNFNRPPWDNHDARMAVAKAIDREDYIDKVLFGLGTPATSAIAPAFGWVYRPPEEVDNPQEYDPDAAKELAEKAGLQGLKPVILSSADDPRPEEVMRNTLREIGLDVQIDQLQTAAANERWLAGDYDMNINGSVVDVDPDDGHWNFFHSEGPWNTYGYKNPEVDQLLEATRTTVDQEQRRELWLQVAEMTAQDVAYVFLYHTPDRAAFRNYVKGYVAVPEQRYFEYVWLDK